MALSRKRNGDMFLDDNLNRTKPDDFCNYYEINDYETISQIERKIQDLKMFGPSALINIFIKNLEGQVTYYLQVESSDTIGNVKAKMGDFAHVLVFNGVSLEDRRTLADLNIVDGSVLTRIEMAPHGKMEIFVHTFTGKTISLLVNPADTIAKVKLWIMYKERVPVDEQVLVFKGMALGDSVILTDFGIHEKSALSLVRRPSGLMTIFVKAYDGKVITVKVNPLSTIGDLKFKIQGQVHVPDDEQELIFDGMVLDNLNTVANSNIKEESTLTLVRISTGHIHIFVGGRDGRTITCKVKPSITVGKLKSKLANMEGISEHQLGFLFEGRLLKENLTLAECHVHNETTLDTLIRQTGD